MRWAIFALIFTHFIFVDAVMVFVLFTEYFQIITVIK